MTPSSHSPEALAAAQEIWDDSISANHNTENWAAIIEKHMRGGTAPRELVEALALIRDTFKKDEAQGYESRDRRFAIEVSESVLAKWEGTK